MTICSQVKHTNLPAKVYLLLDYKCALPKYSINNMRFVKLKVCKVGKYALCILLVKHSFPHSRDSSSHHVFCRIHRIKEIRFTNKYCFFVSESEKTVMHVFFFIMA